MIIFKTFYLISLLNKLGLVFALVTFVLASLSESPIEKWVLLCWIGSSAAWCFAHGVEQLLCKYYKEK